MSKPVIKIIPDREFTGCYIMKTDISRMSSWHKYYIGILDHCKIPYTSHKEVRITAPMFQKLIRKVRRVLQIKLHKACSKELKQILRQENRSMTHYINSVFVLVERVKGITPFTFQRKGVGWLLSQRGCCLADDTGLGKTGQLLMAAMALQLKYENLCVLVVGSKIAEITWKKEVPLWSNFKFHPIKTTKDFRYPQPGELVFSTWAKLPAPRSFGTLPENMVLIGDEIHNVKNPKAQQTKKWNAVKAKTSGSGGWIWGASATPNENDPLNLWNVLRACDCAEAIFGGFNRFKNLMGGYDGTYGIEWSGNVDPVVPHLIKAHVLRRRKRDVINDLPDIVGPNIIPVYLNPRDKRWKTLKALSDEVQGSGLPLQDFLNRAEDTKQTDFEELSETRKMISTIKIPFALDYAEEKSSFEDPLIVMCSSRNAVEAFEGREDWAVIHGGVSTNQRDKIVNNFQSGKLKGLACMIRTAGESLTLSHSRRMLFIDQDWNWAKNYQALGRIDRVAQKRTMFVDVLSIENSIDDRIQEILAQKIKWKDGTFGDYKL